MSIRGSAVGLGIMALVLIVPAPGWSCTGNAVSSCTATCNSNCYLSANITCTNGQGITLNSGADLDMCGKNIQCTSVTCNTAAAVTMTASSSKVYNSLAAPPNNL